MHQLTGLSPIQLQLYRSALQHKSLYQQAHESNERLEFLGDGVLDLAVSEYLFRRFPNETEGYLTELKSKIVSRKHLNKVARQLGLKELLQYKLHSPRDNVNTLLGNALEALVGAIYLDLGYDAAKYFVQDRLLGVLIDVDELEATETNFKSRLYQWAQRERKEVKFRVLHEENRGGRKFFRMVLMVDGEQKTEGEGANKKTAEQMAARVWMESNNLLD